MGFEEEFVAGDCEVGLVWGEPALYEVCD